MSTENPGPATPRMRKVLAAKAVRYRCPYCTRFADEEIGRVSAEPYFRKKKIGNVLVCPECKSIISRDALFCKFCGVYDIGESDILNQYAGCNETFR